MLQLMTRLRTVVSSLGNDGAVANVRSELSRAAAARHAIDQLELRMALLADAQVLHAA
ncbi:MAG: hypothetical protein ACXV9P_18745 [Acidimicrobiia bacterium]